MKTTVSLYDFRRAFEQADRKNFSYEGQEVLFDYLESLESDCGIEYELDVIALCCEYSEDTFDNVASNYDIDISDIDQDDDDDEKAEQLKTIVLDYLNDHTSVVGEVGSDSVIYADF